MPVRLAIVILLVLMGAGSVHADEEAAKLAEGFWAEYRTYTEELEQLEDPRLPAEERKLHADYRDMLAAALEKKARAAKAAGAVISVDALKRRLALDALRKKRKLTKAEAAELEEKAKQLDGEFAGYMKGIGGGGPTPPPSVPDRRPIVRAKDAKSGSGTSKQIADRCKRAKGYVRPPLTIMFVPKNWAKRARARIATKLLAAESALVAHLVACQQKWTAASALGWDTQRKTLARRILALQDEYIWAQVMSVDDWRRWDKRAGQALRRSPQLQTLIRQEGRAERAARIAEAKYYKAAYQYRYGEGIEKFSVANLQHDANMKRAAYWRIANQRLALERPLLHKLAAAHAARYAEQVKKLQAAEPGLTPVTFRELISDSPRVKRLLGPTGEAIFLKQSARRVYAIDKRIGVR